MSALKLYITPKAGAPGFFEGITWLGGRQVLLCTSRTPLLDTARGLVGGGYDPGTILEMWHPDAAGWSLRAPIGTAAKVRVTEGGEFPRFRLWTECDPDAICRRHVSAPASQNDLDVGGPGSEPASARAP